MVCRLCHPCGPRYPRFVHFSWSFPVNWYIQSILYTPQSSQSHPYQLRFSLPCAPQLHTSLSTKLFIHPCQWHRTSSTCLPSLPLPAFLSRSPPFSSLLLVDHAVVGLHLFPCTSSLVYSHPPFSERHSFLSFPRKGTVPFIPASYVALTPTNRVSLLVAAAALPSFIKPFILTGFRAFRLYVNSPCFSPSCDGKGSFTSPTVSFFCSFLYFPPFASFITIHELVTKKNNNAMTLFAYSQRLMGQV